MNLVGRLLNPLVLLQNCLRLLVRIAPFTQAFFIAIVGGFAYVVVSTALGIDMSQALQQSIFGTVVSAAIGWAFGYLSSRQQDSHARRLDGVRRKLDDVYLPLSKSLEQLYVEISSHSGLVPFDQDFGLKSEARKDLLLGVVEKQLTLLDQELRGFETKRTALDTEILKLALNSIPQGQQAAVPLLPILGGNHYQRLRKGSLSLRFVVAGSNGEEHKFADQLDIAFRNSVYTETSFKDVANFEAKVMRRLRRLIGYSNYFKYSCIYMLYREIRVL